jgi:DNA-binding response OmpR family regulator
MENTRKMSKILVVDDDHDILYVMKLLLSNHGFDVKVSMKGEETYEMTEKYSPDLIILDVWLGSGLDGRDICRNLKSKPQTSDIPVIMFSANNNLKDKLSECKADDFVGKPFDIEDMIRRINAHLSLNDKKITA